MALSRLENVADSFNTSETVIKGTVWSFLSYYSVWLTDRLTSWQNILTNVSVLFFVQSNVASFHAGMLFLRKSFLINRKNVVKLAHLASY